MDCKKVAHISTGVHHLMVVSHLCIVSLNIHGISKHRLEYVRRIVKVCIGYLPLPHKHATCNSKGTKTIHISLLGAVYTMDHEVVPRKRPILRGTTSMVRVTKILVFMVHGPFTRCKPNVDHEE